MLRTSLAPSPAGGSAALVLRRRSAALPSPRRAALAVTKACNMQRIGGTSFVVAEQIKTRVPDLVDAQPAVILGAAGVSTNGSTLIKVKVHATGEELVSDAKKDLIKEDARFAPGDAVRRSLYGRPGHEEAATVVSAPSSPGGLVTIRLDGGLTYASEAARLRKVSASPLQAPALEGGLNGIDLSGVYTDFPEKFPELKEKSIKPNVHASPGSNLHARFVAAAAANTPNKVVDVLLHGTPETNVDSILSNGLHGGSTNTSWFTSDLSTAMQYARQGAEPKRLVAFAVLRDKATVGQPITTINDPAHHLPMFEVV